MEGGVDVEDTGPHDAHPDEGAAGQGPEADAPDNKFQTAIGAWRSW